MKKIVLLLLLSLVFISAGAQRKVLKVLNPQRFEQKISHKNALVVDVRTPEEYKEGFIGHAQNADVLSDNFKERMEGFDRKKAVYVYCRSGKRSSRAARILHEMGFRKVYDLKGGILSWKGSLNR